jgi:hypothetical protein
VIRLVALRSQARFYIAQAFPVSQLSKRQAQKLLGTGEILDRVLARIKSATHRRNVVSGKCSVNCAKTSFAYTHKRYPRKWPSQDRSLAARS